MSQGNNKKTYEDKDWKYKQMWMEGTKELGWSIRGKFKWFSRSWNKGLHTDNSLPITESSAFLGLLGGLGLGPCRDRTREQQLAQHPRSPQQLGKASSSFWVSSARQDKKKSLKTIFLEICKKPT